MDSVTSPNRSDTNIFVTPASKTPLWGQAMRQRNGFFTNGIAGTLIS